MFCHMTSRWFLASVCKPKSTKTFKTGADEMTIQLSIEDEGHLQLMAPAQKKGRRAQGCMDILRRLYPRRQEYFSQRVGPPHVTLHVGMGR